MLSSALGFVDRKGLDRLTMRALAEELGIDPMTLYRYVQNREQLLDGIVEAALAELMVESGPEGDWQQHLREYAYGFRRLALAHRQVFPLFVTRPLVSPLARRPLGSLKVIEALLEVFIQAGFNDECALYAYRAFSGFLFGHLLMELHEIVEQPEDPDEIVRLGLYRLPATEFPRLRTLTRQLASGDPAAELDEGLTVLLAHLQSRRTSTLAS
ncbi:TetR/AcrR family transcriptional regulator C-terminal domain-containing protein [Candidatus Nephthysia bennettiae]|uniref:TetR/AcrR family transcriptional regulator C-terminal domain-containing protein n=1 Tax=Candidatus Nephthysia bennettiae TaxID=3127016 RepID=UPI0030C6DF23